MTVNTDLMTCNEQRMNIRKALHMEMNFLSQIMFQAGLQQNK